MEKTSKPSRDELVEGNQKIVGALDLLLGDAVRTSSRIGKKPPNPNRELRRKTKRLNDEKPFKPSGKSERKTERVVCAQPPTSGGYNEAKPINLQSNREIALVEKNLLAW